MWQCFGTCENLIRQLPLLQYDKCNCEDAADGNDHAPEALRYGLMSRPRRSQQPIVKRHAHMTLFPCRNELRAGCKFISRYRKTGKDT